MSESEIITVYQEGIQSVVTLVQGLSTKISELSQTVEKQNKTISDLDARLKKLEKHSNQKLTNKNEIEEVDEYGYTQS